MTNINNIILKNHYNKSMTKQFKYMYMDFENIVAEIRFKYCQFFYIDMLLLLIKVHSFSKMKISNNCKQSLKKHSAGWNHLRQKYVQYNFYLLYFNMSLTPWGIFFYN